VPTVTESSATPDGVEPIRRITRDATEFVLLGTAHVSRASAEAVKSMLADEHYDAVAVELCVHREQALRRPELLRELDLFRVLREGRAGVVAAGLALGAYQRRLAEQFGIEPGAEMLAGIEGAESRTIPCWLVDRDVGLTLRRARAAVGFWERAKLSAGLFAGLLDDTEVAESEIERLKQGDLLESTFTEFARTSPPLYEALIAERDRYMAAALRQQASQWAGGRVLVVVGAGHLEGIARELRAEQATPAAVLAPLQREPLPSNFGRWFGIVLLVFVLGGFAWAFSRGRAMGLDVVAIWVLTTGILGALGAAAAGAHPASIASAFIASPLTPLHPALASGMVSGAVELWARKPRVGDFQTLRDDVVTVRGWWRNRVARVFLVFFLTSLGTAIGVWIAGFRMAARLAN
jgi:pheromone shutdown-related protein TraB